MTNLSQACADFFINNSSSIAKGQPALTERNKILPVRKILEDFNLGGKKMLNTSSNWDNAWNDVFSSPKSPLPPPKFIWAVLLMLILVVLIFSQICKADTPPATMLASWYSTSSLKRDGQWKLTKGVCSDGSYFKDDNLTAASRDYNLGTVLRITSLQSGKSVSVRVTDRINKRFKGKRIDLSRRAFQQIADLRQGLVPVKIERIR